MFKYIQMYLMANKYVRVRKICVQNYKIETNDSVIRYVGGRKGQRPQSKVIL